MKDAKQLSFFLPIIATATKMKLRWTMNWEFPSVPKLSDVTYAFNVLR